ncbi:MAG: endo-1,4-beta-xylanase [Lentisphaerae bacterium]|nr:endo-1,4-beta-xylanase [Lentisphaerota bacterium]
MKKLFAPGMIACALLATTTAFGQEEEKKEEKKPIEVKSLKEAYKGTYLIGTAQDFPRGFSEAELANAIFHYDIVTPENCMKPQPTHPSEDTYNFTTPDALVEWATENGLKVWGHTLLWHSQTGQWFFQDTTAATTNAATTAAAAPTERPARRERPAGAAGERPARPEGAPAGGFPGFGGGAPAGAPGERPARPEGAPAGAPGERPARPEGAPAGAPPAGFGGGNFGGFGGGGFGGFGGGFGGGNAGPQASKEVILERLEKHIKTVVGRYKGKIIGWDVANESIADNGDWTTENLRKSSWYTAVGPEVLTLAFKWAHEADPDAILYYNDYNIEQGASKNTGKHAASLILLKRLIAEGAPIHGVGIQGHWHLDTNLEDVDKAIENYGKLGLRVSITELDVTSTGDNSGAFNVNGGGGGIPPENYEKQAEIYTKLFEIFNKHSDVIERVTFWGISDTRSWRRGQDALLFTGDLEPKPAFKAVLDAAPKKN